MEKILATLGLVVIFIAGCGAQPGSWKIQKPGATPIPVVTAVPTQVTKTPTPTSKPTKKPEQQDMEMDVTDGHGNVLTTGDGRSIFQRVNKPRKRCVVKHVKKGLFIGGEK